MKLKQILESKHIDRKIVAKHLSMTKNAFDKWINETREPDLESLIKLAEFLGVSTDVLLDAGRKGYVQIQMEETKAKELKAILQEIIQQIDFQINGNVQINIGDNQTINNNKDNVHLTINNDYSNKDKK